MIVYMFIIFVFLLFLKKINNKKMNLYDYVFLTILIIICGFRYNVGSDYPTYIKMYNNIVYFPRTEFIPKTIIDILNYFKLPSFCFLTIMALLTIFIFYKNIKNKSSHPSFSIFLFIALGYYAMCFNGVRQMLAVSICIYATNFLINRNFKKYLISIIIASLCHMTAIIMIIPYVFVNINFSKKIYYSILVLSLFIGRLYEPVLQFVTTIFPQYSMYATKTNLTFWEPGPGTYIIGFFHLIILFFCIKNKNCLIEKSVNNQVYLNLFVISAVFFSLSFENALVVRFAYYFSIYLVFLLPDLLEIWFGKKDDKNYLIVLLFLILYFVIHLVSFNDMLPYNSIFE